MIALGVVVCAILLFTGMPLFIAFAIGGLIIITLHADFSLFNIGVFFFDFINNYTLLSVPLFVLVGQLMAESGMGKTLIDLVRSFVGRVPGGIAVVAVITSALMGALTAQNLAVLAAVGAVLFPAMESARYDKGYSAGLLCSSAQLGFLIPPSITFIIYGFLTQSSVVRLFIAGIIPGVLLTVMLCVVAILIAKKRRFPSMPVPGWKERKGLAIKALPGIIMPIVVLGGIYGGIFTATEAAGVACIYTLLVGAFVYRGLTLRKIWGSAVEATRLTSMILILFCGVMLLGRAFTIIGLPQLIGNWVVMVRLTPVVFLTMLCIAFIVLGMIMDAFAMIALLPVVMPAVKLVGIDPIHLGVIFVVASLIGTMTPPAAAAIYFTSALFKVPTIETVRGILPFLATTIVALFILALCPGISTWLPGTMLQ
jgi:C4-dicarboxylate transporter DctM subunit